MKVTLTEPAIAGFYVVSEQRDDGGQLGCVPGQLEAGRSAVAGDEDDILGAEHLAGVVAEVADSHDLHVVTRVVMHWTVALCATVYVRLRPANTRG